MLSRQNLIVFTALDGSDPGVVSESPPQFTIEGLIRLSESVRQRPVAPRPVAAPQNQDPNHGPRPPSRAIQVPLKVPTPPKHPLSAGPSTTTPTLPQTTPAKSIIKFGQASADGPAGIEIIGAATSKDVGIPCTACLDKTINDNFISLKKSRAAGWPVKKLQSNDPRTIEYADGRRRRIVGKTQDTQWVEDEKPTSLNVRYYICEDLTPDVRLGRTWLEHCDTERKSP